MGYAKIDAVLYKIIWYYGVDSKLDVTKYLTSQSSQEGITIENNKIELSFKIIRDKKYSKDNTIALPWYSDNFTGKQQLNTDSFFVIYTKYENGTSIDTESNNDRLKTFYLTDYSIDEPSNRLSVSAVDLQYKIINRNTSRVFGQREVGTSTTIATDTLTDTGASFKVPSSVGKYEDGYKWMTLEITQSGSTNTYMITSNTATAVTVHKTITETTGATYRIGESSPYSLWSVIHESAMDASGRGQSRIPVTVDFTTDYGTDYVSGIQLLRPDNSAFPIIDIGESFMPIFKMVKELSGFAACNTETEMITPNDMPCQRDMIFAINWDDEGKSAIVNWFYLAKTELGSSYTVASVSGSTITVSSATSTDIGGIARVKMVRTIEGTSQTFYRSYTLLSLSSNTFTVSSDAETDGVLASDTIQVYKGTDYIWDSANDFKHIYNLKLGGADEEQYNHVLFDAGRNMVGDRSVLGHWFNEETKSDTLKDTFIPMTHIAKGMMNYCQNPDMTAGGQWVIKKDGDTWYGWDGAAWTDVDADWDFTTTFGLGGGTIYTITSRSDFNLYFKTAARIRGTNLARNLVTNVKENLLKGTIQARGQRFLSVGSSGDTMGQWYRKGSRILLKRIESGLVNDADAYYNLVVTKIRQQIDSTRWTVSLDCEYSKYRQDELIQ